MGDAYELVRKVYMYVCYERWIYVSKEIDRRRDVCMYEVSMTC